MTTTRHAVKAEALEGGVFTLRLFDTREEAESYPVRMKNWKRVWVEAVLRAGQRIIDGPPKHPWTVEWTSSYAYVVDADGNKIASLLGPQKQREYVAEILCGLGAPPTS